MIYQRIGSKGHSIIDAGHTGGMAANMVADINYLIVEDDPASVLIVKRELAASGFKVSYKHSDDREKLEALLSENEFDLIISDHQMPSMSSLDVIEARNRLSPGTPVIIFTMGVSSQVQHEAYRLGCDTVLEKKDISLLPSLVTFYLSKKRDLSKQ
jgi:CheY-like chemotaxis protein